MTAAASMPSTLIFPAVTPEARAYYRQAVKEGRRVIAAASVVLDRTCYECWEFLPSVNDERFPSAFDDLVRRHNVTSVFVPVPSAHFFLRRFIAERMPQLHLANPSPFEAQAEYFRNLLNRADDLLPLERSIAEGRSRLSRESMAAILRQAMSIHGESGEEKLAAMMGIFARAPQGDVVEIGSLMGRTAAALRLLADWYGIGPLLTVDPWEQAGAIQHDSPSFVQDMAYAWEPGALEAGFTINMLGLGASNHAHIRLPSTAAHAEYAVGNIPLGIAGREVRFSQRIAVLHIDANHDYAEVLNDWALWGKHLVPGGWLILDDYVWMHGEGPRRVGDDLLLRERIGRSFVCGKAFFGQATAELGE